jgi:hypothetical protein
MGRQKEMYEKSLPVLGVKTLEKELNYLIFVKEKTQSTKQIKKEN